MDWKLILQLSGFGFAMGLATVYLIPSAIEPVFWACIFATSAYLLARRVRTRLLLHGVCVGLANSLWITAAHLALFHPYIARHATEAAMMASLPLPDAPRLMMALAGPVFGVVSGAVMGLLALVVAKFVTARAPA